MKIKLIALAIITLLAQSICAQNIFKAIVKDGDTKRDTGWRECRS